MSDYIVTLNEDTKYKVTIINKDCIIFNNKKMTYAVKESSPGNYLLKVDNKVYDINLKIIDGKYLINLKGETFNAVVQTPLEEKAKELLTKRGLSNSNLLITAPMPGMMIKIKISEGDAVKKGQSIAILEAMKMENDLIANQSGTVKEIYVKEGQSVEKNQKLFLIA